MFEYLKKALDTAGAKGADYADARITRTRIEHNSVKDGRPAQASYSNEMGIGVRVLSGGYWGFASVSGTGAEDAEKAAADAVETARASAAAGGPKAVLAPEETYKDNWASPREIDPFEVPLADKLAHLTEVDALLRAEKAVSTALSQMWFRNQHIWMMTTEGSEIEQDTMEAGAGCEAVAVANGEVQTRSYPMVFGGKYKQAGYEIIREWDMVANAPRVAEEAVKLLTAPVCPDTTCDLILLTQMLSLQIHESVGHPIELDRALGYENDYAGGSFIDPSMLGKLKYGSEIVNIVCDGTLPGGLATRMYDDDAVKAQKFHIVEDGVFKSYLTNREGAAFLGEPRSRGNNRAADYRNNPIVRVGNVYLVPGDLEYDDLVASTENGIIMENVRSWSIDQKRVNFAFACEVAWEVKDGKVGRLLKNPNYQGSTVEFWNSCDAVCNEKYFDNWGYPNCAKGQPSQQAPVSHGCSPARFKNIRVGVRG